MSGIPPNIPSSATSEGLHTPAHEWASKTTSALDPETTNTAGSMNPTTEEMLSKNPKYQHPERALPPEASRNLTSSSTASTPGVPGAFKEDKSVPAEQHFNLSETATMVTQTVQSTAQKAGETAAQYLPKSVVDTVSAYIPSSTIRASAHDVPHVRSLPSTELKGTQPGEHIGGVGSLPGNISEVSVGKLPDERSEANQSGISREIPSQRGRSVGGTVAAAAAGAGATAGAMYAGRKHATRGQGGSQQVSGSSDIKLPVETQYTERRSQVLLGHEGHDEHEPAHPVRPYESLPIEEFPSTSRGGVGSLPGTTDESGVAILPDEKKTQSGEGWGVTGAMAGAAAGVGATVGGVYEAVKSRVSGQPAETTPNKDTKETTLSSTEKPSTSAVGVGSLPGLSKEPIGGVGALPGEKGEEGVGVLPSERTSVGAQTRGRRPSLRDELEEQERRGHEFEDKRAKALAAATAGAAAAGGAAAAISAKDRPVAGESRKSDGEVPKAQAPGATPATGRRASEGTRDESAKKFKEEAAATGVMGAGAAAAVAGTRAASGKDEDAKKMPGSKAQEVRDEHKATSQAKSGQRDVRDVDDSRDCQRTVEYSDGGRRREEDEKLPGRSGDPGLVANLRRVTLTPRTHPLGGNGARFGGVNVGGGAYCRGEGVDLPEEEGGASDSGYHPAELHPRDQKYTEASKTSEGIGPKSEQPGHEGVSEKAHETKTAATDDKNQDKTKKVGFMEKMKGEAKILLGKVEGGKKGEEKIEEGKRLKSGEAHVAASPTK